MKEFEIKCRVKPKNKCPFTMLAMGCEECPYGDDK
jgi:hypothetical protein